MGVVCEVCFVKLPREAKRPYCIEHSTYSRRLMRPEALRKFRKSGETAHLVGIEDSQGFEGGS